MDSITHTGPSSTRPSGFNLVSQLDSLSSLGFRPNQSIFYPVKPHPKDFRPLRSKIQSTNRSTSAHSLTRFKAGQPSSRVIQSGLWVSGPISSMTCTQFWAQLSPATTGSVQWIFMLVQASLEKTPPGSTHFQSIQTSSTRFHNILDQFNPILEHYNTVSEHFSQVQLSFRTF